MAVRKGSFGSDAQIIEVQAQNDKAELLAVPFIIREAWLHMNASGVEFLYLTVETENDGFKTIADSSTTGVKAQVLGLNGFPTDFTVESEKLTGLKFFAPRGLRVSEYQVTDNRGKSKKAKTYYVA
jgi:hypothetical protein